MKQNIFIAALLAGMLALAGCGGGSSTTSDDDTTTTTTATETTETAAETISAAIAECADDACVEGEIAKAEADDSGVSAEELADLKAEADARKMAIAAAAGDQPLAGNELAAANQLADALAGSEALQLGSRHINPSDAKLLGNVAWDDGPKGTSIGSIGGWTGTSYEERNPEGSSGEEQDMHVWTENPVYISEKYDVFFGTGGKGLADGIATNAPATVQGEEGVLVLKGTETLTPKDRENFPSNFFTQGFKQISHDPTPDNNDTSDAAPRWELIGNFYGVVGKFVCTSGCTASTDDTTISNPIGVTAGVPGAAVVNFVPSNFDEDETDVPAQFAKEANPNFLSFGSYWSTVLDDDGKVTALRVDPFAGGGVKYTAIGGIVESGTGNLTATYAGGAAGVYVTTIEDDNSDEVPTGYGEFTADANFTAKFGTSSNTVYGTISNFARVAGTGAGADPGDWTVNAGTAAKPLTIGATSGSVTNTDASFHAQFQGQVAATRQSNGHGYAPYGLVGTFQDSFDDGHATGAFGTECRGGNCTKQN